MFLDDDDDDDDDDDGWGYVGLYLDEVYLFLVDGTLGFGTGFLGCVAWYWVFVRETDVLGYTLCVPCDVLCEYFCPWHCLPVYPGLHMQSLAWWMHKPPLRHGGLHSAETHRKKCSFILQLYTKHKNTLKNNPLGASWNRESNEPLG